MENGFNPETPSVSAELRAALELSTDGILVYLPVASGGKVHYRLSVANTAACNMFRATERSLLRQEALREIDPDAFWPCCTTIAAPYGAAEPPGWYFHEQRAFSSGFVRIYTNIDEQRRASLFASDRHRFYRSISLQERARVSVLEPIFDVAGQVIDFRIEFANYGDGIDDSHRDFEPYASDIIGRLVTEIQPAIRQTPVWEFYLHCLDSKEPQRTELWYGGNGGSTALEVQGRRLDDGRLLVSYSDISEQHHLSQELESEKAWLSTLFNNVPVGILILEAIRDENGMLCDLRMTRRNEMGSRLSRIPQELFDRKLPLTQLLDNGAYLVPKLLEIVRTGIPSSHEMYQESNDSWLRGKAVKHGDGLLITLEDVTDAHRRTQEIQDQADLLAGVMEATPHAMMVFQAIRDEGGAITDFKMLRCNRRSSELLFIPQDRLLDETMFSWEPGQRERLPAFRDVIEDRQVEVYESYSQEHGRWRRITNTPFKDGFVTTLEDITEQKNAAAETEEQAKLFNAVLNHTPAATAVYSAVRDDQGEITDFRPVLINRQALRITGMTHDEFMSISLWERMKTGGATGPYAAFRRVVETGEMLNFEHESVFTKNWLSTTAARFGDGFIASSQDLSVHKAQLRTIERQARLFNGVMKSLRNGLIIYRIHRKPDGRLEDLEYLEVADSVIRDTKKSREELIGRRLSEVFPGIEGTEYWHAYERMLETGEDQHFQSHYNQHGLDNHLLHWLTPIGEDLMVSTYYIINDLKQTQRELEHTVRELRRSNEDLEQFASVASHDLQEPLRKVQSFGNMLEARFAEILGAEGKDLIHRMQNAAARMRNLVTGLLTFSRLSGEDESAATPVDLHGLIHELAADLRIGHEGPAPQIGIEGQLPFVMGIESQLRQLFHNLLTNALKFATTGKPAEVQIRHGVPEPFHLEKLAPGARSEQFTCITIEDRGIGFEAEYAEKIFGLFERLHGMNSYQGTGIGLSIARRVVERHGGAIWAQGEPGSGATFSILLRRAL